MYIYIYTHIICIYIHTFTYIYIYTEFKKHAVNVFFELSICSEAPTENVKKTLSIADGKHKEHVMNTSRNRTTREPQKRNFRETHASYVKSLPEPIKLDDLGRLVPRTGLAEKT